MTALLAGCGGFLLAVLWMDLIFDTQVLGQKREGGALPEPVLASIAAYYKRATTDSHPMGRLIASVMGVGLVTAVIALVRGEGSLLLRLLALTLLAGPVALAATRVVPNAVRLGARKDDAVTQSALARGICRDHLLCLVGVAGFLAVELALTFGG